MLGRCCEAQNVYVKMSEYGCTCKGAAFLIIGNSRILYFADKGTRNLWRQESL